ncbi:unnamed protein product [Moneuplotes crassus]|uniref:Cyclic nucleotide-binding domain-containing protein n=1 Tax=Euplotes crassus TaxID=5936 RepID=A0AAD1UNM0_EUPCR|nr:unnamed protein product [Moneuplotes crassus]
MTYRKPKESPFLCLIFPNSRFKITWDLIIIVLSVYNAILIPYQFAYTIHADVIIEIFNRFTDVAFMVDILIHFRTAYVNSKTGKLVTDGKIIAIKYIVFGRFPIDLLASLPLELSTLIIPTSEQNLRFISMVKLARLLRLGRMISFLRQNQKLQYSMKIGQLLFFIFLTMHWLSCLWAVITRSEEEWFPPKDLDFRNTKAYTGSNQDRYIIYAYYAILTIAGNELLPTNYVEILIAEFMFLLGTVFIGAIIGEFTNLISVMTKKNTKLNEQEDVISTVMMNIKIPEHLQRRVLDYYDETIESKLIWSNEFFNYLSSTDAETIKNYQIKNTLHKLSFINRKNKKELEKFCRNLEHSFYLPDDIIIKQGYFNNDFYFLHQGLLEVVQHSCDFMFFDYKEVQATFETKKKREQKEVKSEEIFEENSLSDNNPSTSQPFKRRTTYAFNMNKSTNELDEVSDLPDGSIISELSLVKRNSDKMYEDSFSHYNSMAMNRFKKRSTVQFKTAKTRNAATLDNLLRSPTIKRECSFSRISEIKTIKSKQRAEHKVINELSCGQYFGEISLLTRLPPTASIHVISTSICFKLRREKFNEFLDNCPDCKRKIKKNIFNYNDFYFKQMHKMVKHIDQFYYLPYDSKRRIIFLCKHIKFNPGERIVIFKQNVPKFWFIIEGSVDIYCVNPENNSRRHFQTLPKGSCFNLVNCMLKQHSLFEVSAGQGLTLGEITREGMIEESKSDIFLKDTIDTILHEFAPQGRKYDYDYFDINVKHEKKAREISLIKPKKKFNHSFKRIGSIPMSPQKLKRKKGFLSPQISNKKLHLLAANSNSFRKKERILIHPITNLKHKKKLKWALARFRYIDYLFEERRKHELFALNQKLESRKYHYFDKKHSCEEVSIPIRNLNLSKMNQKTPMESERISAMCSERIDRFTSVVNTALESNKAKIFELQEKILINTVKSVSSVSEEEVICPIVQGELINFELANDRYKRKNLRKSLNNYDQKSSPDPDRKNIYNTERSEWHDGIEINNLFENKLYKSIENIYDEETDEQRSVIEFDKVYPYKFD